MNSRQRNADDRIFHADLETLAPCSEHGRWGGRSAHATQPARIRILRRATERATYLHHEMFGPVRGRRRQRRPAQSGFTMAEIAIALGVIAFALVAIIGILPRGLQVQRDNRAETIINQDGTYWMNAIKSGARGMDELTNLVDRIEIHYNIDNSLPPATTTHTAFRSGWEIIGLLTTPARTNSEVYASVWALSGSAAEKEPNPNDRAVAFKYRLRVNIEPAPGNTRSFTDATAPRDLTQPQTHPLTSLYDIRLTLGYPLVNDAGRALTDPPLPVRAQTIRSSASRRVILDDIGGVTYTFFTP